MKYYIPTFKLEKLKKLVTRLSKKTEVKFSYDEKDIKQNRVLIDNGVYAYYEEIGVELEVDYKVGDYEIVAELEHTPNGNIIRQINTEYDVPKSYWECDPYCEHCKTNRLRKNTFLLIDANKNYRQVGSSCLNDFIGWDSLKLAEMCSDLSCLLETDWDEDEELLDFLREGNWDNLKIMANKFYQILMKNGYDKYSPFVDLNKTDYDESLDKEVDELLKVINTDWYDENSDYCHNVKMILNMDWIESKHWKILISYLWSAMKYLAKKNFKNEHFGTIGERITFKVNSVVVLYTKWNKWASTWRNDVFDYVYRIVTEDGHVVIWTTDKEVRKDMTIKATIKAFDEYEHEKQTVVTRGSIL